MAHEMEQSRKELAGRLNVLQGLKMVVQFAVSTNYCFMALCCKKKKKKKKKRTTEVLHVEAGNLTQPANG